MQAITTIGLDIAKSVFQVHRVDAEGNVVLRRQMKRRVPLVEFTAGRCRPYPALGAARRVWPACHHPRRDRHIRAAANQTLQPVDSGDRIDDWLYLPETLYAFMLIIIVSAGAGPYRLDALILA
jgi:hypothetical protein